MTLRAGAADRGTRSERRHDPPSHRPS